MVSGYDWPEHQSIELRRGRWREDQHRRDAKGRFTDGQHVEVNWKGARFPGVVRGNGRDRDGYHVVDIQRGFGGIQRAKVQPSAMKPKESARRAKGRKAAGVAAPIAVFGVGMGVMAHQVHKNQQRNMRAATGPAPKWPTIRDQQEMDRRRIKPDEALKRKRRWRP